jgi:hypothetical protein
MGNFFTCQNILGNLFIVLFNFLFFFFIVVGRLEAISLCQSKVSLNFAWKAVNFKNRDFTIHASGFEVIKPRYGLDGYPWFMTRPSFDEKSVC